MKTRLCLSVLFGQFQLNPGPDRGGQVGQGHGAEPFAFQMGLSAQGRALAGCRGPWPSRLVTGTIAGEVEDVHTREWDRGCSWECRKMLGAAGSR